MLSPCLEELSLCRDPLCHTGPEPPVSTAHQPSHETLSRDPLYHPPNQDSTQASPRQPKERTPWREAVVAKERETQETGQQRRVEEPPMLSSHVCRMLTRPALLNCWGQNQSDRWGRCDRGHQQLQPDSPTVYTANLPGQLQPPGQLQSPRAPASCGGLCQPHPPELHIPSSQESPLSSQEIMSIQGV